MFIKRKNTKKGKPILTEFLDVGILLHAGQLSFVKQLLSNITRFVTGYFLMSGANIQACKKVRK